MPVFKYRMLRRKRKPETKLLQRHTIVPALRPSETFLCTDTQHSGKRYSVSGNAADPMRRRMILVRARKPLSRGFSA